MVAFLELIIIALVSLFAVPVIVGFIALEVVFCLDLSVLLVTTALWELRIIINSLVPTVPIPLLSGYQIPCSVQR